MLSVPMWQFCFLSVFSHGVSFETEAEVVIASGKSFSELPNKLYQAPAFLDYNDLEN